MIHKNSLYSYGIIKTKLNERESSIMEIFNSGKRFTDREVLNIIKPDSDNMNFVRPRLTELISKGLLKEVGKKGENGRNVRVLTISELKTQQQLF